MNRNNQFFIDQIRALELININVNNGVEFDVIESTYYFDDYKDIWMRIWLSSPGREDLVFTKMVGRDQFVALAKKAEEAGYMTGEDLIVDNIYSKIGVLKPSNGTRAIDEIAHVMQHWKAGVTAHLKVTRDTIECRCDNYGIRFSYH